jgi:hypothetical protein
MDSNWKLLVQMGLPEGAIRSSLGHRVEKSDTICQAVCTLVARNLDPTETDVLAAWLSGFRHHWPSAFAELLGEVGESSLKMLLPRVAPNRYLKLRRIAIANLANLL